MDGRREYCIACRDVQTQTRIKRACSLCAGHCPALLRGNKGIWSFWQIANSLWRFGPQGPVGLDYTAIFQIAPLYRIAMTKSIFEKLKALENRELIRIYKGRK